MKVTDEQRAHVRSLEREGGRITPDIVIADAKKKTSPIHGLFDWNKDRAAYAHWVDTAREVIWSCTVLVEHHETEFRPLEGYVRDPDAKGNEQGYRSIDALTRAPVAARRESLVYALQMAAGNLRRALNLSVAFGLESKIDKLIEQVLGLQRTLSEDRPSRSVRARKTAGAVVPRSRPNGKDVGQHASL